MGIIIYHNPACGTSRNVLEIIRATGQEPRVVEYLKHPPSRNELENIIKRSGLSVREILRQKAPPYEELGLSSDTWSDEELIGFMLEHPILINRPVVITPLGVRLCRPAEKVYEILAA